MSCNNRYPDWEAFNHGPGILCDLPEGHEGDHHWTHVVSLGPQECSCGNSFITWP